MITANEAQVKSFENVEMFLNKRFNDVVKNIEQKIIECTKKGELEVDIEVIVDEHEAKYIRLIKQCLNHYGFECKNEHLSMMKTVVGLDRIVAKFKVAW